jgi:hypothetical protein
VPGDGARQILRPWQNVRAINLLETARRRQLKREIADSCPIVERPPTW